MNKRWRWMVPGKLEIQLMAGVVLSFLAAGLVFVLFQAVGEGLVEEYLSSSSFSAQQTLRAGENLRDTVENGHISTEARTQLAAWVKKEKYLNIYLYRNNTFLYQIDTMGDIGEYPVIANAGMTQIEIRFSDGVTSVYLDGFYEYKYYNLMVYLSLVLAFVAFMSVLLPLIRRKTRDIRSLEAAIKILESGDLNYPVRLRGRDELASLAESLDAMRRTFADKLDREEKSRASHTALATAVSHDLRTPLTAILGYLDIITMKKYNSDAQLMHYLRICREKSYQMKALSDKLFDYFLLMNAREEDIDLRSYDGRALLDQLTEEQVFLLAQHGFTTAVLPADRPFRMEADVMYLRRVMDNIFSNILKYADPAAQVTVRCMPEPAQVCFEVENQIASGKNPGESSGLGMAICSQLMTRMGGHVAVQTDGKTFRVRLLFPMV